MKWSRHARVPERVEQGDTILEARGISVHYGRFPILREVDLMVRAGEVVALVGPNGSGKSTLLNTLAGDFVPSSGAIMLYGQPLSSWSTTERALRRAVLPQHITVSFPFLVGDVVRMGRAAWAGTPDEAIDDRAVEDAMRFTDIEHLADRQFPSLSGGERARASLARVLAQRTQLILLDEPTAALDLHHQELVLQQLAAQAKAGQAAVVVLHDLGLASAYANRVALLDRGAIVADGLPAEVLRSDLLSRAYHQEIEVIPHPRTGAPLIVPRRA